MALPEKVIEQLGREGPRTPGWSFGIISFAFGFFFIVVVIYVGITFGYEPYIAGKISADKAAMDQLNKSIPAADQTKLIGFYSQVSNLKSLLANHIVASQFFAWLEKDTEANVYYQSLGVGSGNVVNLTGTAKTQADLDQQIAIFETAPEIISVSVTSVAPADGGGFTFNATLVMTLSLFTHSGI